MPKICGNDRVSATAGDTQPPAGAVGSASVRAHRSEKPAAIMGASVSVAWMGDFATDARQMVRKDAFDALLVGPVQIAIEVKRIRDRLSASMLHNLETTLVDLPDALEHPVRKIEQADRATVTRRVISETPARPTPPASLRSAGAALRKVRSWRQAKSHLKPRAAFVIINDVPWRRSLQTARDRGRSRVLCPRFPAGDQTPPPQGGGCHGRHR